MAARPYVLASWAMSFDGCLDDASDQRLVLSNAEDLDRVDELRASCDAILVGAGTIRRDDPRLTVRSPVRRAARTARAARAARTAKGCPSDPCKVTLTRSGDLDPGARFFRTGAGARLVYLAGTGPVDSAATGLVELAGTGPVDSAATGLVEPAGTGPVDSAATGLVEPAGTSAGRELDLERRVGALQARVGDTARVVAVEAAHGSVWAYLLEDLARRGIRRLLVEGGGTVLTELLGEGLVDELRVATAPFLVGDPSAPRALGPRAYPWTPDRPMRLTGVEAIGDVVVARYRAPG